MSKGRGDNDRRERSTPRGNSTSGVTRRGVIQLAGGAGVGLAVASLTWLPALGQEVTPEPDPVADPVAEGTPDAESEFADILGGELTVYSGRSESLVAGILNRFGAVTGITVDIRYASTGELAATILEEGDSTPADVFFAQDAGALGLLAKEGLFQKLPDALLNRVDPRFRSTEGLWVGITGRARVLVYNTAELSEGDLPTSVLDLTNERWRGLVGWAPENASFQAFVTALRKLQGEEVARQWLEQMLVNDVVNYGDSNAAIVRAVGLGEVLVGLVNHYYVYAVRAEEGEEFPVANHFFAPGDPGSLINVAGVGVLATTQHEDQAWRFVDFLLSEQAQTFFASQTSEYPLVDGIPAPAGLTPLADLGSPDLDLSDLADLRATQELLTTIGVL